LRGIYLTSIGSISALGASSSEATDAYASGLSGIATRRIEDRRVPVGALSLASEERLAELTREQPAYARLDRSTRLAVRAAREALRRATPAPAAIGVILGSARGATESFERGHTRFAATGRVPSHTSPTTTLGNLASNVARELGAEGFIAELSSACTSSIQSLLLGVAWLRAGLGRACLVGGAEAPLTAFTLAQMEALGLLAEESTAGAPYQPLARPSRNRLVLGEGACLLLLEALNREEALERGALAEIIGVGASVEKGPSSTGISHDGDGLARAMAEALRGHGASVDAVVVHAPGTRNGDRAELAALSRVFEDRVPALCSAKWQTGHTLGASGAFGIELALGLISGVRPSSPPYDSELGAPQGSVDRVLVNSAGFGGVAASVLLKRAS
jgi:3-oxoacyl-(acyl-carrier-protein) synthase